MDDNRPDPSAINDWIRLFEKAKAEPLVPLLPAADYPASGRTTMLSPEGQFTRLCREDYIPRYGFVLLTEECRDALVDLLRGKRVIDVGSGTGFMSHCLAEKGIDVTALDQDDPENTGSGFGFTKTWKLDRVASFDDAPPGEFDVVLLSWPDYESNFAVKVAQSMRPGQTLVFQGEGQGGCTADDDFFEYLQEPLWESDTDAADKLNARHRTFPGYHDRWQVWVKQ